MTAEPGDDRGGASAAIWARDHLPDRPTAPSASQDT
jgi:hypothetical protein